MRVIATQPEAAAASNVECSAGHFLQSLWQRDAILELRRAHSSKCLNNAHHRAVDRSPKVVGFARLEGSSKTLY